MKNLFLVFVAVLITMSCQKQARDILRQEPLTNSEKPDNFYPKPDNIPTHKPNEIVVKFKPGASKKLLTGKSYTKANTMSSEGEFYNVQVEDEHKAVKEFQKNPNVEWAGLNTTHTTQDLFVPNDPSYTSGGQWNLSRIEAPAVWNIGNTGSKDVYVVVLDEGSLYWGCDLNSKLAVNEAEMNGAPNVDDDNNGYTDDKRWWNWFNNSNEIYTGKNGHGTWCESAIGAESGNNLRISGLAPNVKIISLKFLAGFGFDSEAAKAIRYAIWIKQTKGYNIVAISCSWGGGGYSQVLKDAIHAAGLADINVVCAAGNSAQNTLTNPMLPAAYDEDCIISVGASNQNNERAYFSNYSTDTVDYKAVDIYAPGQNNLALSPINHQEGEAELSGTSMACPLVAGSIALLASVQPELNHLQRKQIILNTAKRHPLTLPGTRGILNLNNPVYFGNTETVTPDFTCGIAPPLDLTPPTQMTLRLDSITKNFTTGRALLHISWTPPTDDNAVTGLEFQITPFWGWGFEGNAWTGWSFDVPMDRLYTIRGRGVDSWGNAAAWSNCTGDSCSSTGAITIDFRNAPPPEDNQNPTTPTNLTANNIQTMMFGLAWTASTDNVRVEKYKVIWRPVDRSNWTEGATTNNTPSYLVQHFIEPDTRYECGVIAVDEAGNMSDTAFVFVTTLGEGEPPPPPPPTCNVQSNNLNAVSQGLNVGLSWTVNVSGTCTIQSTKLERWKKEKGAWIDYTVVATNPTSPHQDNVPGAGQYKYRLAFLTSTGETFFSNERQIQVKRK